MLCLLLLNILGSGFNISSNILSCFGLLILIYGGNFFSKFSAFILYSRSIHNLLSALMKMSLSFSNLTIILFFDLFNSIFHLIINFCFHYIKLTNGFNFSLMNFITISFTYKSNIFIYLLPLNILFYKF